MERHQLFEIVLVMALISLVGLLYLAIVSTPPASYSWEAQANGNIDYMFVGSDDTLYAFSDNTITAVGKDGSILWNLTISSNWSILNNWSVPIYSTPTFTKYGVYYAFPIVCENNGCLYVYVIRNISMPRAGVTGCDPCTQLSGYPSAVLAISPQGTIEWAYEVPVNLSCDDIGDETGHWYIVYADGLPTVKAQGSKIFVFHDHAEEVIDDNGGLLFKMDHVSSPVAVDESGMIYAVRCTSATTTYGQYTDDMVLTGEEWGNRSGLVDYPVPSGVIDAYNPDGSLAWSIDIGVVTTKLYVVKDVWPEYNSIPLYANHTLYVPVPKGYAALDTDGSLKWLRQVDNGISMPVSWLYAWGTTYAPLPLMPVDSLGNAYLSRLDRQTQTSSTCMISPDGNVFLSSGHNDSRIPELSQGLQSITGGEGVIYALDNGAEFCCATFDECFEAGRLYAGTILALDIAENASLWQFSVPDEDVYAITLNDSNVADALLRLTGIKGGDSESATGLTLSPIRQKSVTIYPGRDVIYVCYYYAEYEYPVFLNRSRCIFAKGLYALDNNGTLLWEKPVDGFITKSAAGNGAIYYVTNHGKMGGGTVGVATGAALLAMAYLFLRFFMAGTVARARMRIDKNENRNRVLRCIVDNPGATAVDVSRGLAMNIGTVRYHLFVLSMNHKIVYHKEDEKYLRYFTNSGTYTPEERIVLSLLRRESLRRMLDVLAKSPGLTSLELSRRLGVSTTVSHRHINELMERDVIVKVYGTEKGNVFFINEKYRDLILRNLA